MSSVYSSENLTPGWMPAESFIYSFANRGLDSSNNRLGYHLLDQRIIDTTWRAINP
jgi:hypothetical protein